MSRISRYQDSICKFIKTKSCFIRLIKNNDLFTSLMNDSDHLTPIILLTILNSQHKKKNLKIHHGYYIASCVDIMMLIVNILDNEKYYIDTYGHTVVLAFLSEMPIYIFKCLSQNIETAETSIDKEKLLKMTYQLMDYLHNNILKIIHRNDITTTLSVRKTDIIKYRFTDERIINLKYKNLKQIDRDTLLTYIEDKYGNVCNCAFILGWVFGQGEDKYIYDLEKIGYQLGMMIKLANDFINLERDIKYADIISYNFIVNFGIHESFALFMENKLKFIEGCLKLSIFTNTIKEILDSIEKKFDDCLKNTDIELESLYSSFTDTSKIIKTSKTSKISKIVKIDEI